jgi:hypothetical protein
MQVVQHPDDPCLARDVQLGNGLVADDKLGIDGKRLEVCVICDGALLFAIQELATAVELRLDLVVACTDNGGYTEIKQNELDYTIALGMLAEAGLEATYLDPRDRGDLLAAARHCTGIIMGYTSFDAPMIAPLPGLKVIATMSAGFDVVDM